MLLENMIILRYLHNLFDNKRQKLSDVYKTFQKCSEDGNSGRFLVNSQIEAINFDKLTEWLYSTTPNTPKSADTLTFCKDWIYLIEFKSGNYEKGNTRERIIKSVQEKIIDSEKTILGRIVSHIEQIEEESVRLKFIAVVSTLDAGIEPNVSILARLSSGATNLSKAQLELIAGIKKSEEDIKKEHSKYDIIDVWYSELFDLYLQMEGIVDINDICYT